MVLAGCLPSSSSVVTFLSLNGDRLVHSLTFTFAFTFTLAFAQSLSMTENPQPQKEVHKRQRIKVEKYNSTIPVCVVTLLYGFSSWSMSRKVGR